MPAKVYRDLLEVMIKRGGRWSGMDIPEFYDMVEELFTPEEAEVNNAFPRGPLTAIDLSKKMERDEAEIKNILEAMANKGLCTAVEFDGTVFYQGTRFAIGILEFQFMPGDNSARAKKLAKLIHAYKEAYDAKAGLVHMSLNTAEDIDFLCNCDRWNCVVMGTVLKQPKPGLVFNSGFQPVLDPETCISCKTCIDRCPASARSMNSDDKPEVNFDRCFGCAVCVTGCPEEAIVMEAKPEFPAPPSNGKSLREAIKAVAS